MESGNQSILLNLLWCRLSLVGCVVGDGGFPDGDVVVFALVVVCADVGGIAHSVVDC